jgi:DNA polymerase-3 subunit alpha
MRGFLYGQTEYTMFNNTIHLDDYIELAKRSGFDYLTITDNNLYAHYKFYTKCLENNIKPVIGLEITLADTDGYKSKYLLYAKNNEGYRFLLKVSSIVLTNKDISLDEILKHSKDLIIILVFDGSYLERYLISNSNELLVETMNKLDSIYIGYSYTNRLDKLILNEQIVKLANKFNKKVLPLHQCKYLKKQDKKVYEALRLIGGYEEHISDFEDYSFDTNPLEFKEIDEVINNINLSIFKKRVALPKYPNTKGVSSKEYLYALCFKGLQKRLGIVDNQYLIRLHYELSVIEKMGYNDYFLIVWDFIRYAKTHEVLVGPGRGSAAGSLVAYCLGITEVDPLKYDLLFERFLNPERVSMPDIDVDFPDTKRDEVINHVKNLYGEEHVCNISAYSTFQVKSAFRDLQRVYKIPGERIDELIILVEKHGYDFVLENYEDREEIYNLVYLAKNLDGLIRHVSTHAAGIILSSNPLTDIIPVQDGINGLYQSQLEAKDLEKIGLLKMDFLGIRNLTIVSDIMSEISGFDAKALREIPLNDKKTFEMLQKGDTLGIFQLESDGIRRVLQKLKPTCFEDLVAVLALYRPGPMDNIDEFIRRKQTNDFQYPHKVLEPILKSTYGIIVYQEQIMKIAQAIAGYSLAEADILRRAVSKKDAHMLQDLANDFINKSIAKGYSRELAKEIYDLILKFANYGFNRSHSVAYAILSYQMAYFKANYFNVFMSKILNNVIGSTKTLVDYINYSKVRGLVINKPNINVSSNKFELTQNGLFIPFNAVHSIGDVVATQIANERKINGLFKSFEDFKFRMSGISQAVVEALIYSGAFDIFAKTKKSMLDNSSLQDDIFSKHLKDVIVDNKELDFNVLKEKELYYLGMNIEYNLFKDINKLYYSTKSVPFEKIQMNNQAVTIVFFEKIREIKTKNNEVMLVGDISNGTSLIRFVIFSSDYIRLKNIINQNNLFLAIATKSLSNKNEEQIVIKDLKKI